MTDRLRTTDLAVPASNPDAVNGGASGRVRIFRLTEKHLALALLTGFFVGLPVVFIIAMIPLWEQVGEWQPFKWLHGYIARRIENYPSEYRALGAPNFPIRRFFIASTVMTELLLLGNLVALAFRSVRRHVLWVWLRYDRTRFVIDFGIACAVFVGLWVLLLYDHFQIMDWIGSLSRRGGGGDLVFLMILLFPIAGLIVGRMTAVLLVGLAWTGLRALRRGDGRVAKR